MVTNTKKEHIIYHKLGKVMILDNNLSINYDETGQYQYVFVNWLININEKNYDNFFRLRSA